MNNILKKTAIFFILIISIISCTTEDKDQPSYGTRVQLKSITYPSGAIYEYYENNKCQYDIFGKYQYDANGRLYKDTNPSNSNNYETYFYNEDGTIKTMYRYSTSTSFTRTEYTYGINNINAKFYSSSSPNVVASEYNFTLTNGRISDYYRAGFIGTVKFTYDSNGNITSEVGSGYAQTSGNYSITATFDNKPSTMSIKLKGFFGDNYLNNSILTSIYEKAQQVNSFLTYRSVFSTAIYDYQYTYTYNGQGYPLVRTDNSGYKMYYNYEYSK